MKQCIITPVAGKVLIGQAIPALPAVRTALAEATLVIVAGTTNGYVAERILKELGQADGFTRAGFCRGAVIGPGRPADAPKTPFAGDVVIVKGQWQKGKTLFDVADTLGATDVVLKGANAVDLSARKAAVLIADQQAGTGGAILRAVYGRRAQLIVPVGVEKRVPESLEILERHVNGPSAAGPRLMQLPGEVFTELDAIALLTGAAARIISAGGIYGAEGSVWVTLTGTDAQTDAAAKLVADASTEPPCRM